MKTISRIIFCLLLLGVSLPAAAAEAARPEEELILSNDHVIFRFQPETMGLSEMTDRASGVNHIRSVDGRHLLWETAMADGRQIYTITNNYTPCTHCRIEAMPDGGRRAVMEWNDLRWWNEDRVLSVQVRVELPPDDGIARWRIHVENRSDTWGLWSVLFPIVNGFPASGEYDIARPVFASGGSLLPKWTQAVWGRYPGSVWPMSFTSLQKGTDAVYFAALDPDARVKDFILEPIAGLDSQRYPVVFEGRRHRAYPPEPGERLYLTHYPENMGVTGSDFPDLYPVELGVFQGGWVEAAHRYRPWALRQKWARKGPLSGRDDVPEAMKRIGVWIREDWLWEETGGGPESMNAPLLRARDRLGVPVGLHWYRWHQAPFDNLYPHYYPAREGFEARVRHLKDNDILVMPYINGSSVDRNIPDFEDFAPHTVRDEAGGMRHHYYSNQAGRLISMCGNQVFWHDRITRLSDRLLNESGVNGLYVDQVSGLYHELCFDPSHDHPLGGGRYWVDGNRDLLRKIRAAARKQGARGVVTSEGNAEVFIDLLDGNLTWSQPSEREIPLMPIVYSGTTIYFGSPCDYTRSLDYFRFAQGRAFMDGRQNGWMDLGLFRSEHSQKADYLRLCAQTRRAAEKFLTYGRLLRPLLPDPAVAVFELEGMGWAMYEGRRSARLSRAEARLWLAEDGCLGVVLAGYTDEPVEFSYVLDPTREGAGAARYALSEITPEGEKPLGEAAGPIRRTEKIGPGGIRVIQIRPLAPQAPKNRNRPAGLDGELAVRNIHERK